MTQTEAQEAAMIAARSGAAMMLAGRQTRDRAILDALSAGLTERQIVAAMGTRPDPVTGDEKPIISVATINRLRNKDKA